LSPGYACCYDVTDWEVDMSTMKCCLDCGKCFQTAQPASSSSLKAWLCLLSRSPFSLRLMLVEKLLGTKRNDRDCPNLIWRG